MSEAAEPVDGETPPGKPDPKEVRAQTLQAYLDALDAGAAQVRAAQADESIALPDSITKLAGVADVAPPDYLADRQRLRTLKDRLARFNGDVMTHVVNPAQDALEAGQALALGAWSEIVAQYGGD